MNSNTEKMLFNTLDRREKQDITYIHYYLNYEKFQKNTQAMRKKIGQKVNSFYGQFFHLASLYLSDFSKFPKANFISKISGENY